MGQAVDRSEIWLANVGRKPRPVLVLTRCEVIDVRAFVTVAEVTTNIRGLAAEVAFNPARAGLSRNCVINCDGLHTISRSMLTSYVGALDEDTMGRVCGAVSYALGC